MLSLISVDSWVSGQLTDEFETIKDELKQKFFEVLTPTHGRLFLEAEDMVRREVEDVLIATQQARFIDPTIHIRQADYRRSSGENKQGDNGDGIHESH